jgi:hypothetical protein
LDKSRHTKYTKYTLQTYMSNQTYNIYEIISGFDNSKQVREFLKMNKLAKNTDQYTLNQMCWAFDLTKRLQSFKIDAVKFCKFIKDNDMGITGSFILQIIKGMEYNGSDIDIFVKKITPELMTKFAEIIGVNGKTLIKHNYNQKDKKFHNIVSQLAEFNKEGQKFQLIEPHDEYGTIMKYVETFDFDICKNFFDGTSFYVSNLSNIINNKAVYDETYYNERSFVNTTFKNDKTFKQMVKRVCKYNGRGYDILFSHSFIKKLMSEKSDLIILDDVVVTKIVPTNERSEEFITNIKSSQNKFEFIMECMDKKYVTTSFDF